MNYLQIPSNYSSKLYFDTPKRDSFFNSTSSRDDNDAILGKGSFGVVYTAIYKSKNVAVKVISKDDEFKYDSLKRESNILNFNHPNIIQVFKIVDSVEYGAIIMEKFENAKPLQYLLDNCVQRKVDLIHRLRILKDIASALNYCHSHQLCHGDLKPLNIMVVSDNTKKSQQNYACKLFDFGCSFKTNCDKDNNKLLGTVRYCAPEMLQQGKRKETTTAVDVYSFGIIMWQLKENEIPFESMKSNDVIIYQVIKNNLRPDSTILLLNELNENICFQEKSTRNNFYCKSDFLDTMKLSPNLNTPNRSNCKLSSRTEVKKKKKHQDVFYHGRTDKYRTRKNLFVETFKVINDEMEVTETVSTPECFQNLFIDKDLHMRAHDQMFLIENSYIQLYKACWHEDSYMRPSTAKILEDVEKFLKYLQNM